MDCADFKKNIYPYLDNELGHELLREFEEHVAQCPKCSSELKQAKNLFEMLGSLTEEAPSGFLVGVRKKIDNRKAARGLKQLWRSRSLVVSAGLAATCLAVFFALKIYLPSQKDTKSSESFTSKPGDSEVALHKTMEDLSLKPLSPAGKEREAGRKAEMGISIDGVAEDVDVAKLASPPAISSSSAEKFVLAESYVAIDESKDAVIETDHANERDEEQQIAFRGGSAGLKIADEAKMPAEFGEAATTEEKHGTPLAGADRAETEESVRGGAYSEIALADKEVTPEKGTATPASSEIAARPSLTIDSASGGPASPEETEKPAPLSTKKSYQKQIVLLSNKTELDIANIKSIAAANDGKMRLYKREQPHSGKKTAINYLNVDIDVPIKNYHAVSDEIIQLGRERKKRKMEKTDSRPTELATGQQLMKSSDDTVQQVLLINISVIGDTEPAPTEIQEP